MIEGVRVSRQFLAFNHRSLSLTLFPRTVPGASALAFSLLACAWALPRIPFGAPQCRASACRRERAEGRRERRRCKPLWRCSGRSALPRAFGLGRARAPRRPVSKRREADPRRRPSSCPFPPSRRRPPRGLPICHALAAAPFGGIEARGGAGLGERHADSGNIRAASGRSHVREYALAAAPFGGIRIRPRLRRRTTRRRRRPSSNWRERARELARAAAPSG